MENNKQQENQFTRVYGKVEIINNQEYLVKLETGKLAYCPFKNITDIKWLKPQQVLKVNNIYQFITAGLDENRNLVILNFKKANPYHQRVFRKIQQTPNKHENLLAKTKQWIKQDHQ